MDFDAIREALEGVAENSKAKSEAARSEMVQLLAMHGCTLDPMAAMDELRDRNFEVTQAALEISGEFKSNVEEELKRFYSIMPLLPESHKQMIAALTAGWILRYVEDILKDAGLKPKEATEKTSEVKA